MRLQTLMATAILVAWGCNSDGTGPNNHNEQPPPRPPNVAGLYRLDSVEGDPLPFLLDTIPNCAGEDGQGGRNPLDLGR